MMYMVHRSRTFYQANSAKFGNNRFFKEVGRDEYILSLMRPKGNAAVAEQDIHAAVSQHLSEPALPVRRDSSRRDLSGTSSFDRQRPGQDVRAPVSFEARPSSPKVLPRTRSNQPLLGSD